MSFINYKQFVESRSLKSKATNWIIKVFWQQFREIKNVFLDWLQLLNTSWIQSSGNPSVYPIHVFCLILCPCPCVSTEQWTERHKVVKTGLCTERGVSVLRTLVLNCRFTVRNESASCIFTQWTGPAPTLHTEFGWYLRTFGMVYYGDNSN